MRFVDADSFTSDRPWGSLDIAEIQNATIRLHWTDQPYHWHVNEGPEVFVVLDGAVDMHYRDAGQEHVERLTPAVCATPRWATSTWPTLYRRRGSWSSSAREASNRGPSTGAPRLSILLWGDGVNGGVRGSCPAGRARIPIWLRTGWTGERPD